MGICAVNGCGRGATLRERDEYTAVLLCEEHAAALLSEKPFRHPSARSALEASAVPSTGHVFLNGKCCCGETLPASAVPETRDLDVKRLARALHAVKPSWGTVYCEDKARRIAAEYAATPPGPTEETE